MNHTRKPKGPLESLGAAIADIIAKGTLVILGIGLVAFIANNW